MLEYVSSWVQFRMSQIANHKMHFMQATQFCVVDCNHNYVCMHVYLTDMNRMNGESRHY